MKIIDVHAHLGDDCVFDHHISEEDLLKGYEDTPVAGAIVQPSLPRFSLQANREIHDRIARLCASRKMKFWGVASIYPHFTKEEYREEAYRCIKELGFVGLKITPVGHAVDPESEDGMFAFSVANELQVPMMVHTGSGVPFSQPLKIWKAARKYPDLKIVIAHSGMDWDTHQAIFVAKECPNIYLETSWTGIYNTREIYREIGPHRMMFASDHVNNVMVELEKYKQILKPEDMDQVFWKTAESVFICSSPHTSVF